MIAIRNVLFSNYHRRFCNSVRIFSWKAHQKDVNSVSHLPLLKKEVKVVYHLSAFRSHNLFQLVLIPIRKLVRVSLIHLPHQACWIRDLPSINIPFSGISVCVSLWLRSKLIISSNWLPEMAASRPDRDSVGNIPRRTYCLDIWKLPN